MFSCRYDQNLVYLLYITSQCYLFDDAIKLSLQYSTVYSLYTARNISTATFELFWPLRGPFTAPHGPKFSTAPQNFLRPLLSKRAVATATWQP
jgi:hypothetical protein